ncbi:MAG: hypothetical protein KF691_09350 [Phycisphaeraceae bacterium]|nr:hypothetical protein [Phycisphaeraceae bacterium]
MKKVIESIVPREANGRVRGRLLLGIFPGEGIGPEVLRAALEVLDAVESAAGVKVERVAIPEGPFRFDGSGFQNLPDEVASFCHEIFERGGALLCGPGGGRFVYEMRRQFDLFCKVAPIRPVAALAQSARLKPHVVQHADMLVVRDNAGGVYQGQWEDRVDPIGGRVAEHRFSYCQHQVERIVGVGLRLAATRRRRMHVIVKDGGVPSISNLWRDVTMRLGAGSGVECCMMNADYAAYQMIQHPGEFDVIVTPNMVGDILADLGAVFLGSRGMSYSANFAADGRAVYQTGHGGAKDLANTDRANPLAQIFSLAMLLRESFGMDEEASLVESAIDRVLADGWRTDDLAEAGCRCIGTREMGALVAQSVVAGVKVSA